MQFSLDTNHLLVLIFGLGYLAIVFEHTFKINKAGIALLTAALCWGTYFVSGVQPLEANLHTLEFHLGESAQIVLFLIGAMTIVELIDSHQGFSYFTRFLHGHGKRVLLWLVGLTTFFLSAVLDNLTSTIVMLSLLSRLVPSRNERLIMGAMVVIAANAGGAWTVIGDVTTTMLWINNRVSAVAIMQALFLPSLTTLLVSTVCMTFMMKRERVVELTHYHTPREPGALLVLIVGLGALFSVPIVKHVTHLPPYMGVLCGVGVLWIIMDLFHNVEERHHLRVTHMLTKIDISSALFFLGILLSVSSLDAAGILNSVAGTLDQRIGTPELIATIVGIVSAFIDNVPIVAACIGMYGLDAYAVDAPFWALLAFCAGTGGSIMVIGSAAGVAFMGLEEVSFIWYARKIGWVATLGFAAGIAVYLIQAGI